MYREQNSDCKSILILLDVLFPLLMLNSGLKPPLPHHLNLLLLSLLRLLSITAFCLLFFILIVYFFSARRRKLLNLWPVSRGSLNPDTFLADTWVLTRVWWWIEDLKAISERAVFEHAMEILKNLFWVKIGYYLLQGEDELCGGCFCFVLFFDLIESGCDGWLLPIRLRKFEKLIENEGAGFLLVPSVGNESFA